MTYFIDESDKRNQILKKLLKKNNFLVDTYSNFQNIKKNDAIIFAPNKKFDDIEIENFEKNITVFCGNITQENQKKFGQKNIAHKNFLNDEIFAIENSHLTAEGILANILTHSPRSIFENKILILGGGRVGKTFAVLCQKLGLDFAIVSHSKNTFENSFYFSKNNFLGEEFEQKIAEFDVIVNSIPAKILSHNAINSLQKNCLFLEISSIKTIDFDVEFEYVLCPALPQKFCAESAGQALFDCFLRLK